MVREFICIICPNGCEINGKIKEQEDGMKEVLSISGALCARGEEYVRQEIMNPLRNMATSVLVKGGDLPVTSVRLTKPIPKERLSEARDLIRNCCLTAPVLPGAVVIKSILGYDSNVIVTKAVARKEDQNI